MQRISISAGVKENYTNHSIRPSYIPLIETICTDALNIERTVRVPNVLSQDDSFADDNSLGDSSSLDSESPDDDQADESVVGEYAEGIVEGRTQCQNTYTSNRNQHF